MEVLRLITNMRARNDKYFREFLLKISNGEQLTMNDDNITIPEEMVVSCGIQKLRRIIN